MCICVCAGKVVSTNFHMFPRRSRITGIGRHRYRTWFSVCDLPRGRCFLLAEHAPSGLIHAQHIFDERPSAHLFAYANHGGPFEVKRDVTFPAHVLVSFQHARDMRAASPHIRRSRLKSKPRLPSERGESKREAGITQQAHWHPTCVCVCARLRRCHEVC